MKKKIQLGICGIVIVIAVFCYAHIAKAHNIFDSKIDASDYKATTFYMDKKVVQQFRSSEDTLDAMRVKTRIAGNTDQIQVKYALLDVDSEKTLASGQVSGEEFKDSKFFEFVFDTVSDCKNKDFKFVIEEIGNTAENYIDFCYTDIQQADTKLQLGEDAVEGTLVMKTVTNRFDIETFCVLLIFVAYIVVFLKFLYRMFR